MVDKAKQPKRITAKQIAEALRKTGGFVTETSRILGVSHANICQRIKKSPELQKVKAEVIETHIDIAESALLKKIKKEN